MKKSEQELLKARLDAANRDHQADACDRRIEHNPKRYDTEGQALSATIQQTDVELDMPSKNGSTLRARRQ